MDAHESRRFAFVGLGVAAALAVARTQSRGAAPSLL
jgi:hypothetical protein